MAETITTPQVPFPSSARQRPALRREIGFIGLLWWDMVAVIVFSLVIYAWALRVSLPKERIEALIERGAVSSA
jgi:hypothetical protein